MNKSDNSLVQIFFIEGYIVPLLIGLLILFALVKQLTKKPRNVGTIIVLAITFALIASFTFFLVGWRSY